MKAPNLPRFITALFCLLVVLTTNAQQVILPNAFAHNDYRHRRPLKDALDNGFRYVEADVFLKGNKLIVAHVLPYFKGKRTLEEMYLKPLWNQMNQSTAEHGQVFPVTLMIDIKNQSERTFHMLHSLLEKYGPMLSSCTDGKVEPNRVTVVLTGRRPYQLIRSLDKRFVFLDEDLRRTGTDSTAHFYSTASCKYSSILRWKGKRPISEAERTKLQEYVARAHALGRKVRLWASPENKAVWYELLRCNVDLINTDKLLRLKQFLVSENYGLSAEDGSLVHNDVNDTEVE